MQNQIDLNPKGNTYYAEGWSFSRRFPNILVTLSKATGTNTAFVYSLGGGELLAAQTTVKGALKYCTAPDRVLIVKGA